MPTPLVPLARRRGAAVLALVAVLAIGEGCALVLGFDDTTLADSEAGAPAQPDGTTLPEDDASGEDGDSVDAATDRDSSTAPRDADASTDAADGSTVDAASLPHPDCLKLYPTTVRPSASLTPIAVAGQGSYVVRAVEQTTSIAPVRLALCRPGTAKPDVLDTLSIDLTAPYVWDFGPIILDPGTTQLALVYGSPASQVWITSSFTR